MGGHRGQPDQRVGELLRGMDLPADAVATSREWGVGKPDPRFFDNVAKFAPAARDEILYVGDHRDYDVVAAHRAGLRVAMVRRGPLGHLWADHPTSTRICEWVVRSLSELPDLINLHLASDPGLHAPTGRAATT